MKYFYIVLALVFLTSCTQADVVEQETNPAPDVVEQETIDEIENELGELFDDETQMDNEEMSVNTEDEDEEADDDTNEATEAMEDDESDDDEDEMDEQRDDDEQEDNESMDEDEDENESDEDESDDDDTMQAESKVVELETSYRNPAGPVTMNVSYTLGSQGTIESLSVTSPNYAGMTEFNDKAQILIGKTLEEATETYIAGSSLTTPAFHAAIKSSM